MSNENSAAKPEYRPVIQSNSAFEQKYLQERLGVTAEQVKKAIEAVGTDRQELVAYLSKIKKTDDGRVSSAAARR